jgi:hypothetical protein
MRRSVCARILWFVFLLVLCVARLAGAEPANADGAPPQSSEGTVYYCASSWANSVVYFSSPFETNELARNNIQAAYLQFLVQRYKYPNDATNIVCSISQSLTSAQSDRADDEASVKRANHSVTETGWMYRGAAPALAAKSTPAGSAATSHATISPAGATASGPLAAASRAPVAALPAAATSAPATSSGSAPAASAAGQGYYTLCRFQGQQDGHPIMYVTPIIHTTAAAGTIHQDFYTYVTTTYDLSKVQYGSGYCEQVSSSPAQQAYTMSLIEKQWVASKTVVTHIDWTDTPAEVAATNAKVSSAAAAAAVPTAAADQNYVVCASERDGPVIYVSEVFTGVMPPAPAGASRGNGWAQRADEAAFQAPFLAFLQKKYAFKSGSNYPVECGVTFAPNAGGLQAAQKYKQSLEDLAKQNKKQIVETGWTNSAP